MNAESREGAHHSEHFFDVYVPRMEMRAYVSATLIVLPHNLDLNNGMSANSTVTPLPMHGIRQEVYRRDSRIGIKS